MTNLKIKLIQPANIILCKDNVYRYVDHNNKLMTTGFNSKESLIKI